MGRVLVAEMLSLTRVDEQMTCDFQYSDVFAKAIGRVKEPVHNWVQSLGSMARTKFVSQLNGAIQYWVH